MGLGSMRWFLRVLPLRICTPAEQVREAVEVARVVTAKQVIQQQSVLVSPGLLDPIVSANELLDLARRRIRGSNVGRWRTETESGGAMSARWSAINQYTRYAAGSRSEPVRSHLAYLVKQLIPLIDGSIRNDAGSFANAGD